MTDHNCVEAITFDLKVQHFGDSNINYLEVSGACGTCGRKLMFRGPAGLNPASPTVAIDGSEAVFPFLIEGEEYDGNAVGYALSHPGAN